MAETKADTKATTKEKATKEYVPLRNFNEFTQGERVWLHEDERVQALVEGAYLQPADEYDAQVGEAVRNQMERESGVSAGESGPRSGQ